MYRRVCKVSLLVGANLFAAAGSAHAQLTIPGTLPEPVANASRGVNSAVGFGGIEQVQVIGGFAEANAARATFSPVAGAQILSWATTDADTGLSKGFASYRLERDIAVLSPDFQKTFAASAGSSLTGFAKVVGPAGGTATITTQLRFDGSFEVLAGKPDLTFLGSLTIVTTPETGRWRYASDVIFQLKSGASAVDVVASGNQYELVGGMLTQAPYAGAKPVVVSSTASRLEAIATVTFEMASGSVFAFGTAINAFARPAEITGSGAATALRAAEGTVDYSGTGRLSFVLPAGYRLEGDELFDRTVTVVPEPATVLLWLAGLAGLLWQAGRRQPQPLRAATSA